MRKLFYIRLIFIISFAVLVLWGTGDVMRESDQASVIDGSIQLARDGELMGRNFYNYDRTYASYWILSAVYKLNGLEQLGASFSDIVTTGNRVAAVVLLLGLVSAFLICGPCRWWEWIIWLGCLFSPVFLFSAPLLSSNIISAGFLLGLAALMNSKKEGIVSDLGACVLAFFAVAARVDAVLVMPFLACLSSRDGTIVSMLKCRRLWMLSVSSVMAVVLGSAIYDNNTFEPLTFFNGLVFSSFLIFGMNGALLIYVALVVGLIITFIKHRVLFNALLVMSAITPIAFYWNVLYTPRHLMTSVLVILLSVIFVAGREMWAQWLKNKCLKWVFFLTVAVIGVSTFLGFGMKSLKGGRPVIANATLYPTADGLWPMGAYCFFYERLKKAETMPLDHNQRVWKAWTLVNDKEVKDSTIRVRSTALISYGNLWLTLKGIEKSNKHDPTTPVMVDSRSLTKLRLNMTGGLKTESILDNIITEWGAAEVGSSSGEGIFLISNRLQDKDKRWEILTQLGGVTEGDDFIWLDANTNLSDLAGYGPWKWLFVVPDKNIMDFQLWAEQSNIEKRLLISKLKAMTVYSLELSSKNDLFDFDKLSDEVHVFRSALPAFMKRKNY
ncbi:MAG: hypothetical protein ACSHX0_01215 [Akkermansiaceae bacterium]